MKTNFSLILIVTCCLVHVETVAQSFYSSWISYMTPDAGGLGSQTTFQLSIAGRLDFNFPDSTEIVFGDGASGYAGIVSVTDSLILNMRTVHYEVSHSYIEAQGLLVSSIGASQTMIGVNWTGEISFGPESFIILDPFLPNIHSTDFIFERPLSGLVGQAFQHDFNALDLDGDSVSFTLYSDLNLVNIPGYYVPQGATLSSDGFFYWNSPAQAGDYLFYIELKEWYHDHQFAFRSQFIPFLVHIDDWNSIADNNISEALLFAPNPTSSTLTITSQNPITSIQLTDLFGRVVLAHQGQRGKTEMVDVSMLAPSVYFVAVEADGAQVVKRVVVQ